MAIISTNVGPAQTVTTFAAWLVTLPANVVTSGNSYVCNVIGQLTDALQSITGHTTDATHTITVTAPAGQSFVDNANKLTNALAYNSANGSSWESSNNHNSLIFINDNYVTITRMQFKSIGQTTRCVFFNGTNGVISQCIIQSEQRNGLEVLILVAGTSIATNCLCVSMTAGANGSSAQGGSIMVNMTVVRPSDIGVGGGGFGALTSGGTNTYRNCALFGFSDNSTTSAATDGHNCTDIANCPGTTANLVSKTYANQFTNTVSTTQDWRLKTGADCIDAGVTDATNVPAANDIVGTARPSGASWDIGCWEFASAAAAYRARVVRWG